MVQKLKLNISAELRTKTHAKEKSLGQLLRWVLYHPGVVHLVAREDAHRGLSARLCRRELLSVIYRMVALAMLYKMEPLLLLMYPGADVRHRPYKNVPGGESTEPAASNVLCFRHAICDTTLLLEAF